MAEKAVAALGRHTRGKAIPSRRQPPHTGLDAAVLSQIVQHIGGKSSLGHYAQIVQDNPQILSGITSALDRDGDGNPIDDVLGMAKGLFGGSKE